MSDTEPADVDRFRKALAALDRTADPTVDAGRIFDAVHGDLTDDERRAVVDQLIANPEAAETWRLARDLSPPENAATVVPLGRSARRWWPVAAAAALALAVGSQVAGPWRRVEAPVYRSTEQRAIASLLTPGQPLSRNRPVLRWSGIDNARYRLTVLTAALDVVEEVGNLTTPEYTVGPDTLARFPSGAPLLWQVEARISGEGTIVSPTFSVRVE